MYYINYNIFLDFFRIQAYTIGMHRYRLIDNIRVKILTSWYVCSQY